MQDREHSTDMRRAAQRKLRGETGHTKIVHNLAKGAERDGDKRQTAGSKRKRRTSHACRPGRETCGRRTAIVLRVTESNNLCSSANQIAGITEEPDRKYDTRA